MEKKRTSFNKEVEFGLSEFIYFTIKDPHFQQFVNGICDFNKNEQVSVKFPNINDNVIQNIRNSMNKFRDLKPQKQTGNNKHISQVITNYKQFINKEMQRDVCYQEMVLRENIRLDLILLLQFGFRTQNFIINSMNKKLKQGKDSDIQIAEINVIDRKIIVKNPQNNTDIQRIIDKSLSSYIQTFELEVISPKVVIKELMEFLQMKYSFYYSKLDSSEDSHLQILQDPFFRQRFSFEDDQMETLHIFIRQKNQKNFKPLKQIVRIIQDETFEVFIEPSYNQLLVVNNMITKSKFAEKISEKYDFLIQINNDTIEIFGKLFIELLINIY